MKEIIQKTLNDFENDYADIDDLKTYTISILEAQNEELKRRNKELKDFIDLKEEDEDGWIGRRSENRFLINKNKQLIKELTTN